MLFSRHSCKVAAFKKKLVLEFIVFFSETFETKLIATKEKDPVQEI